MTPSLRAQRSTQPALALERKTWITGDDLVDAEPGFDAATQRPVLNFRFDATGADIFAKVTTRNVGRPFAIVLDD